MLRSGRLGLAGSLAGGLDSAGTLEILAGWSMDLE